MKKTIQILGFFAVALMAFGTQALAATPYYGYSGGSSSQTSASGTSGTNTTPSNMTASTTPTGGSTSFNTDPADFKTVEVTNYTKNPKCTDCWGSTVSVNSGEILSVKIYFHNTGSSNAIGTYLKVSAPSGTGSFANVYGGVGASNATYTSGKATVYKSSGQTFNYNDGSAKLYKTQADIKNNTPVFLSMSEVNNLFGNSGYNIGNVNTGWSNQGALVLQFKVMAQVISSAPTSTTTSASGITQTSATLNGNFNSNGVKTFTWFAWSLDPNKTGGSASTTDKLTPQVEQTSSQGSYQVGLNGLTPDTTYYFRAISQNKNGTTYSPTVLSFKTAGATASTQCNDGVDNDGDGFTDLSDPACGGNSQGTTEFPYNNNPINTQCNNGIDDDNDGYTDLNDPACAGNPLNNNEFPQNNTPVRTQCNDGYDNDGDGLVDLADPACNGNQYDTSEYPPNNVFQYQCSDGIDNDNDGYTDMSDPACTTTTQNTELPNNAVVQNGTVNAATLVASPVYQTSARFVGVMVSSGTGSAQTYFEWGTSTSLGNQTVSQYLPAGEVSVFETVTNLIPNTIYYYRTVGKKGNLSSYGDIRVFRTTPIGTPNPTPTETRGTTTSTNSFIALNIETTFKTVKVKDIVSYEVKYKNISKSDLEGVVVRVVLPKELKFSRATIGEFSDSENTLTVAVGNLKAGAESKFTVETVVTSKPKSTNLIVATAIAAYKNPLLLAQDESIAYELINVGDAGKTASALGAASLFGSDSFLPSTLLGWLLLALVIFAIVFIGRRMYMNSANTPKGLPVEKA